MTTLRKIYWFKQYCGALGMGGRERLWTTEALHTVHLYSVQSAFYSFFPTFYLFYWELKSKIGSFFNSPHCRFYSILQSSTIKLTMQFLLILEQYTCTVYIVCNVSNLLKGPTEWKKIWKSKPNLNNLVNLTHPLLYTVTLLWTPLSW